MKTREVATSRRGVLAGALAACIMPPTHGWCEDRDDAIERRFPSADEWLEDHPYVPTLGARDGTTVLVEFMDYRCTYCRALQPSLTRLTTAFSSLRIAVAEQPIYGDVSTYAARLALIASQTGVFRPVHEALFAGLDHDETMVLHAARAAGLPSGAAADPDLVRTADKQIARIARDASAMGLVGTPTLMIGTKVIRGALSYEDLHDLIAQQDAAPKK